MRWRGRRQSGNVTDIRGGGGAGGGFRIPGGTGGGMGGGLGGGGLGGGTIRIPSGGSRNAGGGLGCGTLVIIGVVLWFLGINPLTILSGLGGGIGGGLEQQLNPDRTQPRLDPGNAGTGGREDEMKQFVSTIMGSTEEVWDGIFKTYGKQYPHPELVLFEGRVNSACGMASAASGPFYCPGDKKIYIDLAFYRQLAQQFGAPGDFAQAYVLAHEVGHHVQNLVGVLPQFNRMRQSMGKLEVNKMSVRVELQADCFAGVWGHYVSKEGWLEAGDLEEALKAANQIGDDNIQKQTQGYVVPDAFNHGTSEQRRFWFRRGYESGRIESCDTFNARDL